jgi:hypothetical protein
MFDSRAGPGVDRVTHVSEQPYCLLGPHDDRPAQAGSIQRIEVRHFDLSPETGDFHQAHV